MTPRMWIALVAVVFLIAAVGFCVWWWLPRAEAELIEDGEQCPDCLRFTFYPGLGCMVCGYGLQGNGPDDPDEQWADELHQIALDLPGGVAPAPAAGEHHCGVCGQVHDDETRLDPGWFGRWEVEQAEWMAGFHRDRDAFNEWLAAA